MIIRDETPADVEAIRTLNYSAFKNHPHHEPGAEPTEHLIVDKLRETGNLTLSMVAKDKGQIVGHIAFSPVTIDGKKNLWFGLGPVAVLPAQQNNGIGSLIIRTAIKQIKQLHANGIVVMGDPGYYGRFGFEQNKAITSPGIPPEYFMAMSLTGTEASGTVSYHPAFFL